MNYLVFEVFIWVKKFRCLQLAMYGLRCGGIVQQIKQVLTMHWYRLHRFSKLRCVSLSKWSLCLFHFLFKVFWYFDTTVASSCFQYKLRICVYTMNIFFQYVIKNLAFEGFLKFS